MRIAWNKNYCFPLPAGHRFPMEKYELLPEQLMHEGIIERNQIFNPEPAEDQIIKMVHDEGYVEKLKSNTLSKQEVRATGFPHSKELYEREVTIVGGTLQCVEYAKKDGLAFNIAGGTHHAFSNRGEGFCLLNDIAISSRWAINTGLCKQVLVIDLDVHHGNGTAQIFQDDKSVFTFSMHGANNYPLKKQKSDLDVAVEDHAGDDIYLEILNKHLRPLIDTVKPDLIHYQCGVDVLGSDKLGRLELSIQGCMERDIMVFEQCYSYGLPVVCTMGGGYSANIRDIVNAHVNTYRVGRNIYY